jgi:ATP-binding protein involved in chromosome partitioning
MTENEIKAILGGVKYPGFDRNIVELGFVQNIASAVDQIAVDLKIAASSSQIAQTLREDIATAFANAGHKNVVLNIVQPQAPKETSSRGKSLAPNIKRFVMISSGKGGVGKTTTSVNLAIAMAMQGKKVGLLDADIYGPNVPRMMGLTNERLNARADKIIPPLAYGVKTMSMGMILEAGQALIWRGPMIMRTIEQFFTDVVWGELDALFMDMPPGTGDAQLSLAQSVPVGAGVIVTTPQTVALDDAKRGLDMFVKMHIPIAGMVENMSRFICPRCNEEHDIFGRGACEDLAREYGVDMLAQIPIEPAIREGSDNGKPIAFDHPSSETAKRYLLAADRLWNFLERNEGNSAEIQPVSDKS